MSLYSTVRALLFTTTTSAVLLSAVIASAVMDPRFELNPEALQASKTPVKAQKTSQRQYARTTKEQSSSKSAKGGIYTVKPGDHLFKILMRDYGLSNSEAESFIEEIRLENNIYDIKRIKIGQKIVIPPVRRGADGSLKLMQPVRPGYTSDAVPGQSFKLESPLQPIPEHEVVAKTHGIWNRIIPVTAGQQKPMAMQTSSFSLKLDPERYPMFARMDGGRIILDQNGSIPPLVKSLIEDKDSTIKIVSETPVGTKHFMASLLGSAGFYSVEENFNMEFGVDPKITIQADFKIEKTSESIAKQDIVLVNSGRTSLPPQLGEFLKKEGFYLYEPFASLKPFAARDSRTIHYVSAKKQPEVIDAILSAFSVTSEHERNVDVFASDNNGISLSVKADRYFERGGHRFVVTNFDGDPINYTLFRILQTKGYKVVIIESQDDFRKISEKLISTMKINGSFAQHGLLQDVAAGYSLQMSGFKLDDAMLPGGGIFLTDRAMDHFVRDLFIGNGFNINGK